LVDELGYSRWPAAAPDWMRAAPDAPTLARRAGPTNRQQRLIGARNARTGQGDSRDNYLVGREQVLAVYRQLARRYAQVKRVDVVQANGAIHHHVDVQAALADRPRRELVGLPTYAPWLNPIAKLWRWWRQDVLKLHRLADDWHTLRERVSAFLDQFAAGSHALLRSTGLIGDGHLAYVRRSA
jgi:putative transposase